VDAKAHVFQFQNSDDLAVYNHDDALVREIAETAAGKTGAALWPFLNNKFVHIQQGEFYFGDEKICPTEVVKLPGEHNLRNAAAAISAVWDEIRGDKTAVEKGLGNFHGLPHRLKFVCEIGGVKFYDDSIATTPGSVIAAVKSFDAPKILILGGHDKGANYGELGQEIRERNVRVVLAIGANRAKVAAELRATTDTEIHELYTKKIAEIVEESYKIAEPGDIVILSPAASSFDMFRNYKDRGDKFIAAVNNLGKSL